MNINKMIDNDYLKRDIFWFYLATKLYAKYYIRKIYLFFAQRRKLGYPHTLQFPITNKCNLDCVMCNIHGNDSKNELSKDEISRILQDSIFKKVESVGVNGGEPFILKNLVEYIEVIIDTLPSIKKLYIISNGTIPNCTEQIKSIKKICSEKGVFFTLSFSLDGYGKMHDEMRGKEGTFDKLMHTVDLILPNKEKYCDRLNFICTLTKKNIYYVNELEIFAQKKGIEISYNIATDHFRLKNDIKYDQYSLFTDKRAKMLAREFLYAKFIQTKSKNYYALFRYLENDQPIRCADCQYLYDAITLNPNGDICYCATHSKTLANVKDKMVNIEKIYFDNVRYNDEIKQNYCRTCSHYMGSLNNSAYKDYIKEILKTKKKPMRG